MAAIYLRAVPPFKIFELRTKILLFLRSSNHFLLFSIFYLINKNVFAEDLLKELNL